METLIEKETKKRYAIIKDAIARNYPDVDVFLKGKIYKRLNVRLTLTDDYLKTPEELTETLQNHLSVFVGSGWFSIGDHDYNAAALNRYKKENKQKLLLQLANELLDDLKENESVYHEYLNDEGKMLISDIEKNAERYFMYTTFSFKRKEVKI